MSKEIECEFYNSESGFDFTNLAPNEVPVNNFKGKNYLLREASDANKSSYQFKVSKCLRGQGKNARVLGNLFECDAYLLSLCLVEVLPEGGSRAVPQAQIQTWPSRVVKWLADTLKQMSGMEVDDKEEGDDDDPKDD